METISVSNSNLDSILQGKTVCSTHQLAAEKPTPLVSYNSKLHQRKPEYETNTNPVKAIWITPTTVLSVEIKQAAEKSGDH
jgi:hypothetical protein